MVAAAKAKNTYLYSTRYLLGTFKKEASRNFANHKLPREGKLLQCYKEKETFIYYL